ncbi:hypothetical protein LCGC14_1601430 [marine sediment metagenome]|uniref:Uncharacterized protein n=1 Tax=marine sediment metagenome TaxID=412755 RepID=A0A0F9IBF1_9ZZZZ
MTRTFTTATDEGVIDMIRSAQRRLSVIAPGVTTPVAKALAERMIDLPELSLTVILDADPEVYRMGYGEPEALTIIRGASKDSMFDLREQPGVRIGVIISDDRTMVYAPVSRNVEAGSTSAERPNAIVLGGSATDALAVASGTTPELEMPETGPVQEPPPSQEIGQAALEPSKIERMEADLKAYPPRPFDLTRRLTVFVSEVQFVELRLTNAMLSSRKIRLLPHFLKFEDVGLRQDIESSLKIPIGLTEQLEVMFESHRGIEILPEVEGKEPKKFENIKISEDDLKRERKAIERTFFYDWKGRGKVILRKDKEKFKRELDRLLAMTKAYQAALEDQFESERKKFRDRMVAEFLEFWKQSPPDHLKRRDSVDGASCKQDIERAADQMFDRAVTLGAPDASDIYKDISIEDLKDEELMASLRKLMEDAGVDPATMRKLFRSGDAIAAQGSAI